MACAELDAAPGKPPIPTVDGAQSLLESRIMEVLSGGGWWWSHPFGVSSVSPHGHQATVRLDAYTSDFSHRRATRVSHVIERLLPVAVPDVQVHGPIGLRVATANHRDMLLTLLGTNARVLLRASGEAAGWDTAIGEYAKLCTNQGIKPLWHNTGLSGEEYRDLSEYRRLEEDRNELAWLGSGLLRRIALFYNYSSAYSIKSWITGSEWRFELDHSRDTRVNHDGFISALVDERWGLPLRLTGRHCQCDLPRDLIGAIEGDRACTIFLSPAEPTYRGTLQIRFRSLGSGGPNYDPRRELELVGADHKWLGRVFGDEGAVRSIAWRERCR